MNAFITKKLSYILKLNKTDFHTENDYSLDQKDSRSYVGALVIIFKLESPLNLAQEGQKGYSPLGSQNVINLTDNYHLTRAQFRLLNRGLTFVPVLDTHKNQKIQI